MLEQVITRDDSSAPSLRGEKALITEAVRSIAGQALWHMSRYQALYADSDQGVSWCGGLGLPPVHRRFAGGLLTLGTYDESGYGTRPLIYETDGKIRCSQKETACEDRYDGMLGVLPPALYIAKGVSWASPAITANAS